VCRNNLSLFVAVLWFEKNYLSVATEERYFPLFILYCMT
jgi:hypothetical protein